MNRSINSILSRWGDSIALARRLDVYTGQEQVMLQVVHFEKGDGYPSSQALEVPLTQKDVWELKNICEIMLKSLDEAIPNARREKGEWTEHD